MITDRTIEDVNTARAIIQSPDTDWQNLTAEQITALERGTCDIVMLNRVEAKQAEIKSILDSIGYYVGIINKTDWTANDLFDYDNYIRLLTNLDKLKQAYYIYQSTPDTPTYMYGYQEANNIEKILVDLEDMISEMEGKYRQCGTFQCGEVNAN